ncbi:Uncharacterized conserved protein YciI, contains a putative active-site phosphohistidine [Lutibacter oricola]|uniref:Uncharacterized conserved protein YciI, contains a putative active-site phosphohistidine n=1 Tax=Lutibacter oricola TaxID=762486 RepID=A0A1H2ZKT2_9FLAO|nr:YciI family protein [Lutibacter oricola]SDX18102.1 Uncharacterized conserved protein YciI, contains a putative active-site phosphohistidine [Lutibacter oricola]
MKTTITFIAIAILLSCCKQPVNQLPKEVKTSEIKFNAELAKKIGADDYGMKKYVIAFLKRGPNRNQDSITKIELQKGHMENINKLANEGKLVLAGPFFGNDDLRGIYIFNVKTLNEAKKLTETDPAIKAGSLQMELKEWYGSASLMLINDLHKSISKTEI